MTVAKTLKLFSFEAFSTSCQIDVFVDVAVEDAACKSIANNERNTIADIFTVVEIFILMTSAFFFLKCIVLDIVKFFKLFDYIYFVIVPFLLTLGGTFCLVSVA